MKLRFLLFFYLTFSLACSKQKRSNNAAYKMQDFVINIANYARSFNSKFIVIPQNGVELAFNNNEPNEGLNTNYMAAINAIGVEELFYNGKYALDSNRLFMLKKLRLDKKIMVSEYVSNVNNIQDAHNRNSNEGFVSFVRNESNYNYNQIYKSIVNENSINVTNTDFAKNYLYFINSENYTSKEDVINEISNTNFDVVIIDLFFNGIAFTSSEINRLKTKANGAKRLVISYINIGSAENYRYYWKKNWRLHRPLWLKRKYEGYDDEYWVKFWNKDWQDIIYGNDNSYIKKIINAGFDGAYLDNVEAYYFLYYKD